MSKVYEDKFGITRCSECDAELLCDQFGDMPEICPNCGAQLDYSSYESVN